MEIANKYQKSFTYSAVVEYIPPNGRGAEVTINNEIDAFMPKPRAAALYNGNKPTFKAKDVIQIKIFSIDEEQHSLLVESALRQETPYSFEDRDKKQSTTSKSTPPKEKVRNFTFADLLSESSKNALNKG
jgi:ribosomal protein S1